MQLHKHIITKLRMSAQQAIALVSGQVAPAPLPRIGNTRDQNDVLLENKVLMGIQSKELRSVRKTADNFFSVTDAISAIMGCDENYARNKWSREKKKSEHQKGAFRFPVKYYIFPSKTARADLSAPILAREGDKRSTPCLHFKDLLMILSRLKSPLSKVIAAEMANLSTRATAGDEALEAALAFRRAELPQEDRDAMRAGLLCSNSSKVSSVVVPTEECLALQTKLISQLERLLESKDSQIADKKQIISAQQQIISEQAGRLAQFKIIMAQEVRIARLEEQNVSCKRRRLLLAASPAPGTAPEDAQYPPGSTRKGDAAFPFLMEEHARVFGEKLARSLTNHAKQVRDEYIREHAPAPNAESGEVDEEAAALVASEASQEALEALRDSARQVLRLDDDARLKALFAAVHGSRVHSAVSQVICQRLPRNTFNSTQLPLGHLFIYLVAKNRWALGDELQRESELEATLAQEVLGADMYLYTLDEPSGLVRQGTAEYDERCAALAKARQGDSDALTYFQGLGIPGRYLQAELQVCEA